MITKFAKHKYWTMLKIYRAFGRGLNEMLPKKDGALIGWCLNGMVPEWDGALMG